MQASTKQCVVCKKYKRETQFKKHTRKDLLKKYGRMNTCASCFLKKEKAYNREYSKNRRATDPLYKLTQNYRSRTAAAFRNNGYKKESRSYELLGCEYGDLMKHIEKKFTKGMSWDNYGKWHIDHIYPVSRARDKQHLEQLCKYTNLQPLWAVDNIKKSNKV